MVLLGSFLAVFALLWSFFFLTRRNWSCISCKIEKQGGELLVYRELDGDYSNKKKYMALLLEELKSVPGLTINNCFCTYYDDPKSISKSRLRFDVGCIIDEPKAEVLEKLKTNYQVERADKKNYLVSELPTNFFIGFLPGINCIYPIFERFQMQNSQYQDGPVMEICNKAGKVICFRKNLDLLN